MPAVQPGILRRIHNLWIRFGIFAFIAMPVLAFLTFRAQGLPPDTWQETDTISIERSDDYLRFAALERGSQRQHALIVPGCPVEAAAYAPLARALALRGLTTIVVKVPYRCAPLPSHVAMLHSSVAALVGACTECDWTIVGHSRGAVHALDLVAAMPGRFSSLVIAGSTHPREKDFSRVPIRVMKVIATNDGVAPMAMSDSNRRLLPPSVRWEIIEGGNHSQFGYYGFQIFDGRATISRQEQHSHVVDSILSFSRGSS